MKYEASSRTGLLPERVLIVDDLSTNRKLLRAILEAERVAVYEAGDGLEALALLEQQPVQAVISDILMPRMDGFQLCYTLRHRAEFESLPLIVYTSTYTSPEDRELAMVLGADDYITKPAVAKDLIAALHRATTQSDSNQRANISSIIPTEDVLMKKYASTLFRKLEKRNRELETAVAKLESLNQELEQRVRERTARLEAANQELDAFCYSASHDLRAPVRQISGFARVLNSRNRPQMDPAGQENLDRIIAIAARMDELIDDLLHLSHVNRAELNLLPVSLGILANNVMTRLRETDPARSAKVVIGDNITVHADPKLLLIVLENLLGNAWKFTSKKSEARIEIGTFTEPAGCQVYFVRDNGAGFDMQYAGKLFGVFQRLHSQHEFPGTGVGLATAQRIIHRHGGRIWAESAPVRGTTFFFTLAEPPKHFEPMVTDHD